MRIWIYEIGEPLPVEPDVRLSRYGLLTKEWVKEGHQVTWWTSTFSHQKKKNIIPPGKTTTPEGVELITYRGVPYKKNISAQRVLHHIVSGIRFYRGFSHESPPDIIVTTVPTIECSLAVFLRARRKKIPFYLDIRDCWPDVVEAVLSRYQKVMARPFLFIYKRVLRFLVENSTGVLSTNEKFLRYGLGISKRFRRHTDRALPIPYPHTQFIKKKATYGNQLNVCFIGRFGRFVDLDTLVQSIKSLDADNNVHFYLCGDSSENRGTKIFSNRKNVTLTGWLTQTKITELLLSCDIGLIPRLEGQYFSLSNKLPEYLMGGLVILSSFDKETDLLLKNYDCGFSYQEGDAGELTSLIRKLKEDPGLRQRMGENARRLFEERFTCEKVAKDYLDHFIDIER